MELNVLSIQIATLFDNYLDTFVPRLEEKTSTNSNIYAAFPELPEAGLRTRVKYFHDMALTASWTEIAQKWREAHNASKPGWIGLTPWGATASLIANIPDQATREFYLRLAKFLSVASVSCFQDPLGHWSSAVAHMATLHQIWPNKPISEEMAKDDIAESYYRIAASSGAKSKILGAMQVISSNTPFPLALEWNVREHLQNAASDAQTLPGFSSVTAANGRITAVVNLSEFLRKKTRGTVAFPFVISRGEYDPIPEPRYHNYLYDEWATCSAFSYPGQMNGADLLKDWDDAISGRLADLIGSTISRDPLRWLQTLAQSLPQGIGRDMVKKIQGDLQKLIDDASALLGGAKKNTRLPMDFEGVLASATGNFDMSDAEITVEVKKEKISPESWKWAESLVKDDLVFVKSTGYHPADIGKSGSDTLTLKLRKA